MSTTSIGRLAEEEVAKLLKFKKHKIVAMNWQTRRCEIDIISTYKSTVYFTEVKYRSSSAWGDGLAYVTNAKLKQMKYAAETWIAGNNWSKDAMLQAASVDVNMRIEIVEITD